MTVHDNVAYGLRLRGLPRAEVAARAQEALERIGLGALGGRHPGQLSGGQQQRVSLARALVLEPDVLLLDEPLSNLDAQLRVEMRREIRRLQREVGITTIYVTHDQEEALQLSDVIAVMSQGRVEQVGTAEEVYARPRSPFVATSLGAAALLRGEAQADGSLLVGGQRLSLGLPDSVAGRTVRRRDTAGERDRVRPGRARARCAATVTERAYLGHAWRIVARVGNGIDLTAIHPARRSRSDRRCGCGRAGHGGGGGGVTEVFRHTGHAAPRGPQGLPPASVHGAAGSGRAGDRLCVRSRPGVPPFAADAVAVRPARLPRRRAPLRAEADDPRRAARRRRPASCPAPFPPGEWMVEVDIHCVIARPDGAPNRYDLAIETLAVGRGPRRRSPPWPAPPIARGRGRRWYRGELHLHSTHSDGDWTPAEIAEAARPRDLDFMVLSDHNTTSSYEEFRSLVDPRTLVIPGTELTTYNGHCLAIGVEEWIDWRTGLAGRSINDVARAVRAAGGIFVVAHPDAMPDDVCTGCRWTHDDFDPALADAVEIWGGLWDGPEEENEGCVALWQRWLGLGHRLAATAATDAHRPKDWKGAVPLTYVLADDLTRPAILDAVRAGRTYVSSGPGAVPRSAADDARRDALRGCARRRGAAPDRERRAGRRGAAVSGQRRQSPAPSCRPWPRPGAAYAELWNADGTLMLARPQAPSI